MRRFELLISVLALTVFSAGCYKIRYTTRQRPNPAPTDESWHHNVIFGLIELTPPVNVSTICPQGMAIVQNEVSFLNALPGLLVSAAASAASNVLRNPAISSAGAISALWSPSTVKVTCGTRRAQMTPLRPEPPAPSPFEVAVRSR